MFVCAVVYAEVLQGGQGTGGAFKGEVRPATKSQRLRFRHIQKQPCSQRQSWRRAGSES